ncbi:hypothetical protein EV182_003939 [Spiromyces aspiralis]|uniref:Uncharacterized protein n=1 Tax=Spiromyces aspiralis TaxID=68401 RepID=A0ACC1HFU5_9FUNG|nr:hypothetical protein EV182_003939 [Spiromyces aspiralis]
MHLVWNHRRMQPIFSSEICVAEAGSVQLEFMKLSEITGDPSYDKKAQKVVDILDKARKPYPGLYPTNIDTLSGKFTGGRISFGAMVDSWYEYLLKQYLLSNKSVEKFRRMYTESIDGMKKKLVAQSLADPSLFYVGEMDDDASVFYGNFGHLTCFVPGMLALGAKELGLDEDLDLAKKLMRTCFKLYNNTVTKLSPESVVFATNADVLDDNGYISPIPAKLRDMPRDSLTIQQGLKDGYFVTKPWYILRPEVVESLFVLYRITGDELYRDWSWQIFLAIENYTKTPIAYSAYDNVMRTNQHKQWRDSMESFFLGETLKYLYLTFSPSDLISLDEFVFNTEAHPFRIIKQ